MAYFKARLVLGIFSTIFGMSFIHVASHVIVFIALMILIGVMWLTGKVINGVKKAFS